MTRARGGSVWRAVFFLAATGLLVSAAAIWFLVPKQYEAYALIKIQAKPETVLESTQTPEEDFALFKATQEQLILQNVVLNAVLRDPSTNRLPSLQEHPHDAVDWLKSNLEISFPGDAEVMRIAISTKSENDSLKIVDKVVDSYLKEVVQLEKSQRMATEAKLNAAYEQMAADYKRELDSLVALERLHSTSGSEAAQLKKRLALDELAGLMSERQHIRQAIRDSDLAIVLDKARSELEEKKSKADSVSLSLPRQEEELLSLPLLEKRRDFLKHELSDTDAKIQAKTEEVAGLDSFSAAVTAKKEELEILRRQKLELKENVERLRIERLAPDRIRKIENAVLEDAESPLRYVLVGSLAGLGVLAGALGLIVGRS